MDVAQFQAFTVPLATIARFCRAHDVAPPVSAERIRKGEVSASFALDLADGARAVLKVYCRSRDPSWLMREAASIEYLRQYGEVPVPGWSRLDVSGEVIGYPCLLMAHIGGVDADEIGPGEPFREVLLMRHCGAALAALHRTPLDHCREVTERGVYPAEAWVERTESHFATAVAKLRRQGWLDEALLNAAEEGWQRGLRSLRAPYEPVFTHRDYQLWNLRVDPDRLEVLGLLDFDAAGLGPAESDVRDLELNLFLQRPWLRREFWLGYGKPAPVGVEADRLRQSALVRALSLLAAYWGPTASVTPATIWLLLSPWTADADALYGD